MTLDSSAEHDRDDAAPDAVKEEPLAGTGVSESPQAASQSATGLLPLPDVGDLLFIGIMYILLVARPSYMFQDGSTGWHLVAGQWMAQSHAIPTSDLFSYTFPSKAWVAYEWLFDLAAYLLTTAGGLNLLAVAISATIAFVFMKVYDRSRALGGPLLLSTVAAIIGIFGSAVHWLARPHVVPFLCIYLTTTTLEDFYRGTISNTRLFITTALIMLLWVNCHPSFPLEVVLICVYFFCSTIALLADRGERQQELQKRTVALLIAAILAGAVTLLNPYGIELHKYIIEYLRGSTLLANTDEYKSPSFHGEFSGLCVEALLLLFLTGLAFSKKRLTLPYLSITILSLHMALSAVRSIPLFAIIVVPAISSLYSETYLSDRLKPMLEQAPQRIKEKILRLAKPFQEFAQQEKLCKMHILPICYTLFMIIAAISGGSIAGNKVMSSGFSDSEMPSKTLVYIKEHSLPYDRGFNYDNWGGLIRYKLNQRVFIDDRADFYGEPFYKKYGAVVQLEPGWKKILDDCKIEWILMPRNARLAFVLKEDAGWKIACQDDASFLFVRAAKN